MAHAFRKSLLTGLFAAMGWAASWAQSSQQVLVLEYMGTEQKRPLEGVSLSVQNAATTMSDASGQLMLQFRSLKAGDAVQLRRVDLSGYEVFNQEAVDAWTISPSRPFTLVLCQSEKFRALCEKYQATAIASYQRQLERENAAVAKLLKEGKIKKQEHDEKLAALARQYNEQLDNLEMYVERFARIDLSEVDAEEQQIILLVQEGEIDEAIRRYEELNLLARYQQQSAEINEVRHTQQQLHNLGQQKAEAADSLRQMLLKQIELYEQQGQQAKADSLRRQL